MSHISTQDQPDPALAAVAMVLRISYTAVARAVADYQAGVREATGTLPHQAALAWRAIRQYEELVAHDSHSPASAAPVGEVPH